MRGDPHATWKAIRTLEKGSSAHHRPPSDLTFRDPDTKVVGTTPAANLRILGDHCQQVYNRDDAPVDYEVLNDIDQHETLHSLGNVSKSAS